MAGFLWRYPSLLVALLLILPAGSLAAQAAGSRGITEPYQDAAVSSTVAGTIVAVRAKEGQFVHEGDVVMELDNALEALEVERRKLVWDSKVEVEAARVKVETLKKDLEGTRTLYSTTRSVSQDDLQKKDLDYQLSVADLNALLVAEDREQLEYKIAKAQLERKFIRAPFDGTIVELKLKEGEGCTQQQPLFRVVDTRRCRLVAYLDQASALKMKQGRTVSLKIMEADGPLAVQGTVEFVSPLVDPSSGLRQVKVVFDNPDGRVRPGVAGTIAGER
jgi:RND family efflux transporter MFP subunit